MKINDRYRECVSQVRANKVCAYGFETFAVCVSLGLLSYEDNGPTELPTSYSLTAQGASEADAWEQKRAKQKARANRGAKIRREVYKSMGINPKGE